MTQLEEFRTEKNTVFASDPQSPLTPAQKKTFIGLNYYSENPALRFEKKINKAANRETIKMQTSTGSMQNFKKLGKVNFSVEGQEAELTIYLGDHGDYFMPFKDASSGSETYGAGRYLEPIPLGGDLFLIDFNYAYNPYCAYNDGWTCPLPPAENRLKVPIKAGEKTFEAH